MSRGRGGKTKRRKVEERAPGEGSSEWDGAERRGQLRRKSDKDGTVYQSALATGLAAICALFGFVLTLSVGSGDGPRSFVDFRGDVDAFVTQVSGSAARLEERAALDQLVSLAHSGPVLAIRDQVQFVLQLTAVLAGVVFVFGLISLVHAAATPVGVSLPAVSERVRMLTYGSVGVAVAVLFLFLVSVLLSRSVTLVL